MKVITKEQMFDDFALILEITDAELNFIEEQPERLLNLELMINLMKSHGKNAHIVQITLCSDVRISQYIERLLTVYDSVSWLNREHKFHIKRNITALLN